MAFITCVQQWCNKLNMYVGVFVFQGGGGGVVAVSGQAVYVRRGGGGQEWSSR